MNTTDTAPRDTADTALRKEGVMAILKGNDGWLAIQRKDGTHPNPAMRNLLSGFGGCLEGTETPEEGFLRELEEELPGFDVNPTLLGGVSIDEGGDGRRRCLLLRSPLPWVTSLRICSGAARRGRSN